MNLGKKLSDQAVVPQNKDLQPLFVGASSGMSRYNQQGISPINLSYQSQKASESLNKLKLSMAKKRALEWDKQSINCMVMRGEAVKQKKEVPTLPSDVGIQTMSKRNSE